MTGDKWMTSGANRLKSRMNRTFERRASLDRHTPSPRVLSSFEPSTTTKNHPSFIRRNTKGLTGTYSRLADPIYRRGITPSSPRRGTLHEENIEYPPGTILPRRLGDNSSSAYQEMPHSVKPTFSYPCDPHQDQRDRSPHPQLQRQNVASHEPHHRVTYGYEQSFETNPPYLVQRTGPLYGEARHLHDSPYEEQNAAQYRDLQFGNQSEWRSQEHFVHYSPSQPRQFDPYPKNHHQAEIAFTRQYYANDGIHSHQHVNAERHLNSDRGIAQFRNPHRNKTIDRRLAVPCSDFEAEALYFERQVPHEHSLRQTIPDCMANQNSFGECNDIEVDQSIIYQAASEVAAFRGPSIGKFVSCNDANFERNGYIERRVSDQKKFHLDMLRKNEDFKIVLQLTEIPKGIEQFKRRPRPGDKSDTWDMSLKRRLLDESTERDNKKLRVDLVDCNALKENSNLQKENDNAQKENVSPPSGGEPRTIGAAMAVRFFDGSLEVDINGRSLDSKRQSRQSDPKEQSNGSPDSFGNMGWTNEGSLWG